MSTQPDYVTSYLDRFAKAVLVAREKNSPPFNALAACAQGALESGWGRSELAARCNNLFGVKGGSPWAGPTWQQWTWEYGPIPSTPSAAGTVGGGSGYYRTQALWRAYPSYNEAIIDYASIIDKLAWFEHAKPHADPPQGDGNAILWLSGLMWPGLPRWATAPPATYVADVVALFPMIGDLNARISALISISTDNTVSIK